MNNDYNKQRL